MRLPYIAIDISSDPSLREALRLFSGAPTVPQLFIDCEPIGGSDVIMEMYRTGELHRAFPHSQDTWPNIAIDTDGTQSEAASLLSGRVKLTGAHDKGVTGLALLDGGSHLLSSSWDGTVKVRPTGDDGSPDLTLHSSSSVTCIADHSPASIFWGDTAGGITEYSRSSNRLVSHGQVCEGPVSGLLLDEKHDALLCMLFDGSVLAYSISRRTVRRLLDSSQGAMCIALAHRENYAVIGSADGQLNFVDMNTAEVFQSIDAHRGPVSSVCTLPDGRLASGGWDHRIRIWCEDGLDSVKTLRGHCGWITSLVSFGGGLASSSTDRTVRIWDIESGVCKGISTGQGASVDCLAVGSGALDAYLYSGTSTGSIFAHSVGLHSDREHRGHCDSVWTVALHENGQIVASGGADGLICLWDAGSLERIAAIPAHGSWVTSTVFSGGLLYSGSADRTVRVWELPSTRLARCFEDHGRWINGVAIEHNLLIAGLSDGTVLLRDLAEGGHLHSFKGHQTSVWAVALSADASLAASGSADRTIRLLDLKAGVELAILKGHRCGVTSVALSANGRLAVSASLDRTLKLWDVQSATEMGTMVGHTDRVWMLSLTPDGSTAVSASADGTVRIWNPRTGKGDIILHGRSPFTCCAISNDGRLVVAGDRNGGLHSVKL